MPKAIVWSCKEQSTMDYFTAEQYGELKFITTVDMPLFLNSTRREIWDKEVAHFVAAYDENTDFIITTGQPTAIFAIGVALGKASKVPRFLVWRREDNHYRILDCRRDAIEVNHV